MELIVVIVMGVVFMSMGINDHYNRTKTTNDAVELCLKDKDILYETNNEKVNTIEDMDYIVRGNRKIQKIDICNF